MARVKLERLEGTRPDQRVTLRVTYAQGEALLTVPVAAPLPGQTAKETWRYSLGLLLDALEAWEGTSTEIA